MHNSSAQHTVSILWQRGPVHGTIRVRHGILEHLSLDEGRGTVHGATFACDSPGPHRLDVDLSHVALSPQPGATRVTVEADDHPFTFMLRDVCADYPIVVPAFGVVVTDADDTRTAAQIERDVRDRGLQTTLQTIAAQPEESFAQAAAATRRQVCPTWLGLSRDMRIFEVGYRPEQGYWGYVNPKFHGSAVHVDEVSAGALAYGFAVGRGAACTNPITRNLEERSLPILHSTVVDGDIEYRLCMFVTLERSELTIATLRGTDYLVADGHGAGHMFTADQQEQFDARRDSEVHRDEETVLCMRVEAVNTAAVPRHAWFRNVTHSHDGDASLDASTGCRRFAASGRVYAVTQLNGQPLQHDETAVLLRPGEAAAWQVYVPHQPISVERAAELAQQDFDALHEQCRKFWLAKRNDAATVSLPEPVIDEMVKAGLHHLDLIAYGAEPDGPVAPCVGVYCPIGSESSPIIQYLDSMGLHHLAERAIDYFLVKQHDDGFMQNFGGYMLETGPILWTMGEHYRYTRDAAWVRRVKDHVVRACEYMRAWRMEQDDPSLRGRGLRMQRGKVADPEDAYAHFMLNGYAYAGMQRAAEMLEAIDAGESQRWRDEATRFRADIRESFFDAVGRSPVVPLGDGTWTPTASPWAETDGPVALMTEPETCWTHGTFTARDSMIGSLYLILQEVLDADEPIVDMFLNWHADLMTVRNVGLSQPYYCRHDYAHARRGEVKAFLKTFYNGLTGLADRETYTWWEHYFFASPHKTHEEAWFLMQTRRMLYLERSDTLHLLPAIPRAWLQHGTAIDIQNAASYFGPFSLRVESNEGDRMVWARVECDATRGPGKVVLRLPHPQGRRPRSASTGELDPATETVTLAPSGSTEVIVRY